MDIHCFRSEIHIWTWFLIQFQSVLFQRVKLDWKERQKNDLCVLVFFSPLCVLVFTYIVSLARKLIYYNVSFHRLQIRTGMKFVRTIWHFIYGPKDMNMNKVTYLFIHFTKASTKRRNISVVHSSLRMSINFRFVCLTLVLGNLHIWYISQNIHGVVFSFFLENIWLYRMSQRQTKKVDDKRERERKEKQYFDMTLIGWSCEI